MGPRLVSRGDERRGDVARAEALLQWGRGS